jgi:hypothetical protein
MSRIPAVGPTNTEPEIRDNLIAWTGSNFPAVRLAQAVA